MREPERHKFQTEMKKNIITLFMAIAMGLAASSAVSAQSQSFRLGQWSEIQNSIIKELNKSYVDSLPVSRIMRAGVDAMLEELDPYTIYIPEEENEDLQMMLSKTYGGIGAIIHKKKEIMSSSMSHMQALLQKSTAFSAVTRSLRSTECRPRALKARKAATG